MELTRERMARHEKSDAAWTELCSETNPGGGHLKDEKALSMNSKDAMRWRCLLPTVLSETSSPISRNALASGSASSRISSASEPDASAFRLISRCTLSASARCLLFSLLLLCGLGAKHVTPNFEVEAPTDEIAQKVGAAAEHSRRQLAIEWLGEELPNWFQRCQVRVKVGQIGAGGITTFSFGGGHVFGWDMTVQGSLERILDSVIPHEVSHTIFACHFRRPLPRWADEGAATLAEEGSEQRRQQKLAEEVLPTTRRIPLRELLQITEYPKNMQHVLTLYAEGYSLADYLVQKGGKKRFLSFVQDAHESGWDAAFRKHYEEANIEAVEKKWSRWVVAGSPSMRQADETLLASASSGSTRRTAGDRESVSSENAASIVRSQSPDPNPISQLIADPAPSKSATPKNTLPNTKPFKAPDNGGHTVAPRTETVSAPEPRRKMPVSKPDVADASNAASKSDRSNETEPPSPFILASASAEQRRPRLHLSHPELRRTSGQPSSSEAISRDDGESSQDSGHPSPFAPVVLVGADRQFELREESGSGDQSTTSLRQVSQPPEARGRAAGRSLQSGTPVKPVFNRESTLRFKPFSSK